jgi:glycogen(starch) synthase
MRILMLSWEYPPNVVGGMGRHVAELSPELARQNTELHVVTPTASPDAPPVSTENGVAVHRVFSPALNTSTSIYQRVKEVNQTLEDYLHQLSQQHGPCDLIHSHDWLTGFTALGLKEKWGCPLITTIHATERGRNRGHLSSQLQYAIDNAEKTLTQASERVIVCSGHMANEAQYFFQIPADKLNVIPNGVNINMLKNNVSQADLAEFRAKYAAPDEKVVFSVGRLVYEKGIHLLVQAAPRILQECPQTKFIIAGKGPEADNLKQQVRNLGIADKFNFIGFISDAERNMFLESANCAIFPSLYEPFGIVALEAMALHCPVIVSDVGGFAEVVKHAETGIKIYPDNVDSTIWGVTHALNNTEWTERHARHAYKKVKEIFNWPRIAGLTIDAYRRALAEMHH